MKRFLSSICFLPIAEKLISFLSAFEFFKSSILVSRFFCRIFNAFLLLLNKFVLVSMLLLLTDLDLSFCSCKAFRVILFCKYSRMYPCDISLLISPSWAPLSLEGMPKRVSLAGLMLRPRKTLSRDFVVERGFILVTLSRVSKSTYV